MNHYGIDAPSVINRLVLLGSLAFFMAAFTLLITSPLWFWITFAYFASMGVLFIATALLMLYSSLVLKPKILKSALCELQLRGDERLLDLGCGQGLFLIEAAKLLLKGKAIGIDIWSAKDQSNNCREQTLKHVAKEKLEERIEIVTGDICKLPFPDQSFDIIISSLALHNLKQPKAAIDELLRVLKTGGQFALFDILSVGRYAPYLDSRAMCMKKRSVFYCPKGTILIGKR